MGHLATWPAGRTYLAGLMSQKAPLTRQVALRAITQRASKIGARVASKLVKDPDPEVQTLARQALIRRGTVESIAALAHVSVAK